MVRLLDPVYETAWFGGEVPSYETYQQRAALLGSILTGWGVAKSNGKILVVGCAYGHLLTAIREQGWLDVWGIDGQYAKTRADAVTQIQQVRDRIGVADATSEPAVASFKQGVAGIGRNARFAACVTEDVLSTLSGAIEVSAMLSALRTHVVLDRMVHLISMYDPTQPWNAPLNGNELNTGYYQGEAAWVSQINTGGRSDRVFNLRRPLQPDAAVV